MPNKTPQRVSKSDVMQILEASNSERLQHAYLEYFGLREKRQRPKFQNPDIFIPELSTTPWYEPRSFDWTARFEQAFPIIREELLNLRGQSHFQPSSSCVAGLSLTEFNQKQQATAQSSWAHVSQGQLNSYIFNKWNVWFEENCARCPQTVKLIESVPQLYGGAFFSALTPGTKIARHCGVCNDHLVCHFALTGVENAEFCLADKTRHWEAGKFLIFDDGFEHEVWHCGNHTRIVLILFIWHPNLTQKEIQTIQAIQRLSMNNSKMSQSLNRYMQAIRERKFVIKNDNWWI